MPLSIVKDEPDTINEDYLSYCWRLMTLMLSMPPMSEVVRNLDMELDFDFCEGGPSNGARREIVVYIDGVLRKFFMLKKDSTSNP